MQESAQTVAALPDLLLPWYARNKRDLPWRHTRDPYRIFVSEIMLQQTRVAAVIEYYKRFMALFPTVHALAASQEDVLLKAWEGLGYYSRARNLRRAAAVICQSYNGEFPRTPDALRRLPGVGAYTAGAIASIAFEQPVAAVDGNVLRILARVLERFAPDDEKYRRALSAALSAVYPAQNRGDFTQSFMDFGSAVCLPARPLCTDCPLSAICRAYLHGTVAQLPVRKEKPTRAQKNLTVFVLRNGNRIAVRKRPDTGLLAGMWELPNTEGHLSEQDAVNAVTALGARVVGAFTVRQTKHVFTHIEWHMRVYDVETEGDAHGYVWTAPDSSSEALPTAFRKCL